MSIASTIGSSHLSVSGVIGATRSTYPLQAIRKHLAEFAGRPIEEALGQLPAPSFLDWFETPTARGLLHNAEHAVELSPEEIGPVLLSGSGPDADMTAARAGFRDRVEAASPPAGLGEPEAPPPLDVLPRPMARATAALMTMLEADMAGPSIDALRGTGIGTGCYKGTARVVTNADDALDRLQPGDVLIARFTGPAYNSILPILGALVVETGGPMCHAAIVAREFGLPAIIGAAGATTHVPDGAVVEVDPIAGVVLIAT